MKIEENNQNLLTVVVPIYNMQSTLKRCLDSILNQSIKDLELPEYFIGAFPNQMQHAFNLFREKL